ncbi:hypothetical protein K0651_12735 [Ornithinimicrobium sp. Arc0846-15]|nr:hypothetical protein [Ornithinimicrobium laminariae]
MTLPSAATAPTPCSARRWSAPGLGSKPSFWPWLLPGRRKAVWPVDGDEVTAAGWVTGADGGGRNEGVVLAYGHQAMRRSSTGQICQGGATVRHD